MRDHPPADFYAAARDLDLGFYGYAVSTPGLNHLPSPWFISTGAWPMNWESTADEPNLCTVRSLHLVHQEPNCCGLPSERCSLSVAVTIGHNFQTIALEVSIQAPLVLVSMN